MYGPITITFVIDVKASDMLDAEDIADEFVGIMEDSIRGKYLARVVNTTVDATEFED